MHRLLSKRLLPNESHVSPDFIIFFFVSLCVEDILLSKLQNPVDYLKNAIVTRLSFLKFDVFGDAWFSQDSNSYQRILFVHRRSRSFGFLRAQSLSVLEIPRGDQLGCKQSFEKCLDESGTIHIVLNT